MQVTVITKGRMVAQAVYALILLSACSENDGQAQAGPQSGEVSKLSVSSDHNFAKALLFRWWGIFEAPKQVDREPHFEDLFASDVHLKMPGVELTGVDSIREGFSNLPPDLGRSHQLDTLEVTALTDSRFQLDAAFTYQIARPDGTIEAGHSSYQHEVLKQADGTFRLARLTAELGEPIELDQFEPSYVTNRARGTLSQYLGITDVLESDYSQLSELMSDQSEIYGMFDPATETHNTRGDGVLRGLQEISHWLSTRRSRFQWVAHTITGLEVAPAQDGSFRVTARIEVAAMPHDGDVIEATLPITLTMRDYNERFMQIEKIER